MKCTTKIRSEVFAHFKSFLGQYLVAGVRPHRNTFFYDVYDHLKKNYTLDNNVEVAEIVNTDLIKLYDDLNKQSEVVGTF